jgi:hypothetical protein
VTGSDENYTQNSLDVAFSKKGTHHCSNDARVALQPAAGLPVTQAMMSIGAVLGAASNDGAHYVVKAAGV